MSVATLAPADADFEAIEPTPYSVYEEGDFMVFENVPVWTEHVNRDGVKFGKPELDRVCRRNNERILETGDFSPIVIGHTDDEGVADPPLVGFAGPFVVERQKSRFGRDKTKWTIYAKKFRIFKSDYERTRRYPRLSVEYWANKKEPTNGHFDPICLLGAETPELDLGLRYAHRAANDGAEVIRYSRVSQNPTCPERYGATAPSGSNTFIPGDDSPKRYEMGEPPDSTQESKNMAQLSQEDIMQIVEAMKPVMQAMIEDNASGSLGDPLDAGGDMGAETGAAPVEPPAGTPPVATPPEVPPPAAGPGAAPAAEPPAPAGAAAPAPSDEDDDETKPVKYSAQHYRKDRNDYRTRYHKEVAARRDAEAKLAEVSAKVESAHVEKRKAVRYSRLSELQSAGWNLTVDEELADTASLTDEQFDKHCDKIVARYERIPIGRRTVPMDKPIKEDGTEVNQDLERRQRYSKEAREEVERRRAAGKQVEFFDVLQEVEQKHLNGQAAALP